MTTDPSTSTLYALYHSGAYLCLGILAVYFALKYLSTSDGKIGTWLKVPGRAHYVTAAIGVIGLFVGPLSQGTTPNAMMFFTSLPAIFALLLPGAPKKTDDSRAPQAGFTSPGVMLLIVSIGMALHLGCGASARQKTLFATLATLDGAETGLVAFDQKYQDGIVAACRNDSSCTEAIGHTRLVDYRAKRDVAVKAITAAYVVLGQAFSLDNDPSLKAALAAAAVVATQLSTLGVTP
jgi:hypothetical protein